MRLNDLPIDSFRDINTFLMPRDRLNLGRTCHEIRSHIATFMSQRSETLYIGANNCVVAQVYTDETGLQRGFIVADHDVFEQLFLRKVEYYQGCFLKESIYYHGNKQIISNHGVVNNIKSHTAIDITKGGHPGTDEISHVYIDVENGRIAFHINENITHFANYISYVQSDSYTLTYICDDTKHEMYGKHWTYPMNVYYPKYADYRVDFSTSELVIYNENLDIVVFHDVSDIYYLFGEN